MANPCERAFLWLLEKMLPVVLCLLDLVLGLVYYPWRWLRYQACRRNELDELRERMRLRTVVIVGGNFGGLAALRELEYHEGIRIVLIDKREYFEYTPGVLRLFCEPGLFDDLARPIPKGPFEFVLGTVTTVAQDHVVVASASESSRRISFDYLILATGADYRQPITPALGDSTLALRQATWKREAAKLSAANSVLILGGGAVGAELAAEIVCYYPSKQVTILDAQPHLVPLFPQKTVQYTEQWFKNRGVELLLEQSLERWDDTSCTTKDGRIVKADIVYVCFGMRCNSQCMMAGSMAGSLGKRKEVRVNEHLQVDGEAHVYAVGDVMSNPTGEIKQAYYAEMNGVLAARNILRNIGGLPLLRFPEDIAGATTAPLVYVVSLGRFGGSLGFNKIVVNGCVAAVFKFLIEWTKVAEMQGRPIGLAFWKFGDAVTFALSRWVLRPMAKGSD